MLTTAGKKQLKARAHALKPVVLVGQHGVTPAVLASIDEALLTHELIKIRLPAGERGERAVQTGQIATELGADVVSTIGRVVVLFRRRPESG